MTKVSGSWSLVSGFWQYDFDQQQGASSKWPEIGGLKIFDLRSLNDDPFNKKNKKTFIYF